MMAKESWKDTSWVNLQLHWVYQTTSVGEFATLQCIRTNQPLSLLTPCLSLSLSPHLPLTVVQSLTAPSATPPSSLSQPAATNDLCASHRTPKSTTTTKQSTKVRLSLSLPGLSTHFSRFCGTLLTNGWGKPFNLLAQPLVQLGWCTLHLCVHCVVNNTVCS